MAFTGLYSVLFSAPDMKLARKFFADWGLKKVSDNRSGAVFRTQVGSEIIVRPLSAKNMPPPAAKGMNFREMVWGVSSKTSETTSASVIQRGIWGMGDTCC